VCGGDPVPDLIIAVSEYVRRFWGFVGGLTFACLHGVALGLY